MNFISATFCFVDEHVNHAAMVQMQKTLNKNPISEYQYHFFFEFKPLSSSTKETLNSQSESGGFWGQKNQKLK